MPAPITESIRPATGQTLAGQQVDASAVAVAVQVSGVSGVTLSGLSIACAATTKGVNIVNAKTATMSDLTFTGPATRYVQVGQSDGVTIDLKGNPQGTPNGYVVYAENTSNLTIAGVNAAGGSVGETVVRLMGVCENFAILDCQLANPLNKRTALRVNCGGSGRIERVTNDDICDLGPMGEGDGGQNLPAGPDRQAAINKTLKITVRDSNLSNLGLMPGVVADIASTRITGVVGPQNVRGYPIHKWTQQYPDTAHVLPGDYVRPTPVATFTDVAFVAPPGIKGTCYPGADGKPSFGPFGYLRCTLNGQPIPDTAPVITKPATPMPDKIAITRTVYEDVVKGVTQPITDAPVLLSSIGAKPTVRVETTAPAVRFDLTINTTVSTSTVPTYKGRARLNGDKGITLAPGTYPLTITPADAKGNAVGDPASVTLNIAAPTSPVFVPAPTPAAQTARLTGRMTLGLVDLARAAYAATKDIVAGLKIKSLRVWWNPNGFGSYARDNEVANAIAYEAAGVSAIYCVAQDGMTPAMAANAPAYMLTMVADLVDLYDSTPATKGRTIRIEFGNEPDLKLGGVPKYWTGSIAEYVAALGAVYAAVKAVYGNRVQIIAAGFSWDVDTLAKFAPAIAPACDALAFHGYPSDLSAGSMKRYTDFAALGVKYAKPTIITEGAPGYGTAVKNGTKTLAQWSADFAAYLIALEALGISECLIFNAYDIGTTNSAAAVMDKAGKPTATFAALKAVA